jgi:hypothetical protein
MMVELVGPTANLSEIQVPSNFEYLVRLGGVILLRQLLQTLGVLIIEPG